MKTYYLFKGLQRVPLFLALSLLTFISLMFSSTVVDAACVNCGVWSVVPSANVTSDDYLHATSAISLKDVWAVGDYIPTNSKSGVAQTMIEHWNGTVWSIVPSPNIGTGDNDLYGVAAISATNVWAVGVGSGSTLIEHWNGSKWSVVTSPNMGQLTAITAISASNIWAVGGIAQPSVEHWNGVRWSVVRSPNPGTNSGENVLNSVTAVAANNVWAVGYYASATNPYQTLIEHWNGKIWSVVASPNVPDTHDYLTSVQAVSANDIWAVGSSFTLDSVGQTLVEHWNGKQWSIISSPNTSGTLSGLSGVAVVSSTNVWAVGYSFTGNGTGPTVIEHWNGKKWSIVPSPSPAAGFNSLSSVTRIPGTTSLWAVGNADTTTLTEFYR
jgi:hypothetical protein